MIEDGDCACIVTLHTALPWEMRGIRTKSTCCNQMQQRLQIAFGCNETGYGVGARRPPQNLSIRRGNSILSAWSLNINNTNQASVFRAGVFWEKPITSSAYKQTEADVHKLKTKAGQSNDSDPKVVLVLQNMLIPKCFREEHKAEMEIKGCSAQGKYWYVLPSWLITLREDGISMLREY